LPRCPRRALHHGSSIDCDHMSAASGTHYRLNCQDKISEYPGGEKMCWPHLRVHSLFRDGPEGHCRYFEEQVPYIQALSQDKERGVHPRATMYPAAPSLTSLLRWAPTLPCVTRLWISPPYRGGLQRCHVSCSSRSHLPIEESSDATTCPTALDPSSLRGRALALPRIS
jgi:hypothetical protein